MSAISDHGRQVPSPGGAEQEAERSAAEARLAEVELDGVALRKVGREGLGIVGRRESIRASDVLANSQLSWLPAVVLSGIGALTIVSLVVPLFLSDQMSGALGVSTPWSFMLLARLVGAAVALAALGMVTRRVKDRGRALTIGGFAAAAVAVFEGLSGNSLSLAIFAFVGGFIAVTVQALLWPLLLDIYPPPIRVRVFAIYGGATMLALSALTGVAALNGAVTNLTWRATFVFLSGLTLAFAIAALRVHDPGRGRWDGKVAEAIDASLENVGGVGTASGHSPVTEIEISSGRILRRLMTNRTVFALLGLGVAFGLFLVPTFRYLTLLWRDHWHLSANQQLALYAGLCLAGAFGAWWLAWRGESEFRESPALFFTSVLRVGSFGGLALMLAAVLPTFGLMVAPLVLTFASIAVLLAGAGVGLLALIPQRERAHASGLFVLATLVGAQLMAPLVQSVGSRFGTTWALLVIGFLMAGQAGGLAQRAKVVEGETDRVVDDLIQEEEMRFLVARGVHLPLLSCRSIDFSYGLIQVLFDVTLTVDDGEMVALLGTNGAGKSTLLNVVSGLGAPTRGAVYFQGRDITHMETDLRVRSGISQIAGGRAVFGPMTVLDNLRVFGHSYGRKRRVVEDGIERVFDTFPQLADRRQQLASTLSGGERQMLALGKAYILEPRILLIDELSIGLAPVIVAQLLEMVRQVNASGTAVVLVEQSVNVALSLVDHAYFMERGEIRFDGRASHLFERPDLLRSVFLEGASGHHDLEPTHLEKA